MTNNLGPEEAAKFSEALVSEIKGKMGRLDLSSRALGRLIGESSQYVSMRLDGGNPRTGKRVDLNAGDIAKIATALDMSVVDLIRVAWTAAGLDQEHELP